MSEQSLDLEIDYGAWGIFPNHAGKFHKDA
jgi:hypothetical protein